MYCTWFSTRVWSLIRTLIWVFFFSLFSFSSCLTSICNPWGYDRPLIRVCYVARNRRSLIAAFCHPPSPVGMQYGFHHHHFIRLLLSRSCPGYVNWALQCLIGRVASLIRMGTGWQKMGGHRRLFLVWTCGAQMELKQVGWNLPQFKTRDSVSGSG